MVSIAKGPSYWSAEDALKQAQRDYDGAVKYNQHQPWKIKEAERAKNSAKDHLTKVERTGE